MLTASDMMNTQVISTKPEASITSVIQLLAEHSISGLPVVNEQNKVVGIISEKDILDYCNKYKAIPLSGPSGWLHPYADVSDLVQLKKGFELLDQTNVESVMAKKVVTVKKSTPWHEVAVLMSKNEVNRIPVVDEKQILCGIITRADVISCLASKEEGALVCFDSIEPIELTEDAIMNG